MKAWRDYRGGVSNPRVIVSSLAEADLQRNDLLY